MSDKVCRCSEQQAKSTMILPKSNIQIEGGGTADQITVKIMFPDGTTLALNYVPCGAEITANTMHGDEEPSPAFFSRIEDGVRCNYPRPPENQEQEDERRTQTVVENFSKGQVFVAGILP